MNNYAHITPADTANKKPGYVDTIWIAPIPWFDTLSEPVLATSGAASVTIVADHTFPALGDYGFIEMTLQPDKNGMTGEAVGDTGNKWMKYTATVVVPSDNAKLQVLISTLLNDRLIALIKDRNCPENTVWQLGCDCVPALIQTTSFDGKTGADTTGKAWTITLSSTCRFVYEGAITPMP